VSVIQILDDADVAFRILGICGPFYPQPPCADKPHRLNGRTSVQRFLCFDDLASGYRNGWATRAAGYRAAISALAPLRHARLS
jgi:hypothetical protein